VSLIEEGTYRARPLRGQLGMTGTGKEQVGVEWLLLDGTNRRIWSYHFFSSDKAIEISMEALRNAGFRGNDLSDLSSLTHFDDQPTPECELVIQHEEYNGRTSAKVKFVNSGGGMGMSNPLDGNQARAFAARMRGAIAAFDQARGSGAARLPQKPQPPEEFQASDDDVPF
jgi:hypothetical protein